MEIIKPEYPDWNMEDGQGPTVGKKEPELLRRIGFDYTGRGIGEDEYIGFLTEDDTADKEVERLRKLAIEFRNDPNFTLSDFFKQALDRYYQAVFPIPVALIGHLIYRLSDYVPLDDRQTIPIYPSDYGNLEVDGIKWDSLEDWRTSYWENITAGNIPTLIPQLSEFSGVVQDAVKSR